MDEDGRMTAPHTAPAAVVGIRHGEAVAGGRGDDAAIQKRGNS